MEVTEEIIGKSNLSAAEAKVVRYFYRLPSAGKRSMNWVENLNRNKFSELFKSAQKKLKEHCKNKG